MHRAVKFNALALSAPFYLHSAFYFRCMTTMRAVEKITTAPKFTEGAGFEIHRSVGAVVPKERSDPFLMLDELGPKSYRKGEFEGAPWHPHRGFDTVMYLKQGEGSHQDSSGNKGTLKAGDVQWMTAASGLQHDEGRDHPGGVLHGFQMWVNLPAANKMDPPAYHDIAAGAIPVFESSGVKAKVIAGMVGDVSAIIQPKAKVQHVDFMLESGADYKHVIPKNMTTCMAYVYQGSGVMGANQKTVKERDFVLFDRKFSDGSLVFRSDEGKELSFLLMCGEPLKEPIVSHGPFVMNSQSEIQQCFVDYQRGQLVKFKGTYTKWGSDGKVEKYVNHDDKDATCPYNDRK